MVLRLLCAILPVAASAASSCPSSHPWAYRPSHNFDYCCATADDHIYHGINVLADLNSRSDSCKNDNYAKCDGLACEDFWQASRGAEVSLQDDHVHVTLSTDMSNGGTFGTIISLSQDISGPSLISASQVATSWSASFVTLTTTQAFTVDSSSKATRSVIGSSSARILLRWSELQIADVGFVNISLELTLVNGLLQHRLSFESESDEIGLWDWALLPASGFLLPQGSSNFENAGFGVVHTPPSSFSGIYPRKTMQYMASFSPPGIKNSNLYVAAHDPNAESKTLACVSEAGQAFFSVSATPPGAGLPLAQQPYTMEYPVVLSLFDGDWWDATQIYRNWALDQASWTKQGPMSERDDVPDWLYNITTWVNSHWQGADILDTISGDPAVVQNRIAAINDRFGLGPNKLALHWYEWDTLGYAVGSNYTNCESEVTCGFDTHYPEYFPVREGFEESLKSMQALGVRVAPYINGRIFDKGTATWRNDQAERFASKRANPMLHTPELSTYEEQYGSEAKFAVMCPHTDYWQDTIADVVDQLANSWGTDGVYIDQIAAEGPKDCFDVTHGHPMGGGHHWVDGYNAMLEKVRSVAGKDKVVLTESNSEPFMGGINMFLTLVGFLGDFPSTPMPDSSSVIVPAFQSVYGGYVFSVGAEFFQADFSNPDAFAAKIAVQYVFGAQLGWFSLGSGTDDMGVYEQFMDPAYDEEIRYLRALSDAKIVAADWFNHGRSMRPLNLVLGELDSNHLTSLPEHPRSSKNKHHIGLSFGSVMSSAWLSADGQALMVTVTTVKRGLPARVSAVLDLSIYGFPNAAGNKYSIWTMPLSADPEQKLGVYDGNAVHLNLSLEAREVVVLRVQVDRDEQWV